MSFFYSSYTCNHLGLSLVFVFLPFNMDYKSTYLFLIAQDSTASLTCAIQVQIALLLCDDPHQELREAEVSCGEVQLFHQLTILHLQLTIFNLKHTGQTHHGYHSCHSRGACEHRSAISVNILEIQLVRLSACEHRSAVSWSTAFVIHVLTPSVCEHRSAVSW